MSDSLRSHSRLEITNNSRKQLDAQLKELALLAQQYPKATKGRRIALTQLINAIWQSGKLCHPYRSQFQELYEDIYEEAVQNLFFFICYEDNINKYDPKRGEVMAWVNMLLTKRFFTEAIPQILGKENEINFKNSHIENLSLSASSSLGEQIREYIESDPDRIFIKEYIKDHPEANFQSIAIRRYSGVPWKDISAEWDIGVTTLNRFYQQCLKKFAPKIRASL